MSTFRLARCAVRVHFCHPCRAFTTTPRHDTDHDSPADYGADIKSGSAPCTTSDRFSQLDKDVSIIKVKLDYHEANQKELKKEVDKRFDKVDTELKFDRMLYFFLGAVVLKGGFDFYMQERKEQKLIAHKQQ